MANPVDKLIDTIIYVFIFTSLIGTIALQILTVANVSGAALVLLGLTTLFLVIGFVRFISKQASSGRKR